jgi:hypothetical protein
MWKVIQKGYRYERSDGAVVRYDDRSPWPNPLEPTAKMFTAWEPNPSQRYLSMSRGRPRRDMDGDLKRPTFPRRWKTPEAAMRAVDKEYQING